MRDDEKVLRINTTVIPAFLKRQSTEAFMVTPQQVTLVQESWAKVVPIADQAAELFYGKLFAADPSLKALFKGDMKAQGKKLMQMITVAVNGLTNLEKIVPAVQELGKRHAGYGVQPAHYDTVGGALLATLNDGLGAAFTADVKAAWTAVYGVLAGTMKTAAYGKA
jgi:hemoglobin-like flavoprotein